MTVAVGAEAPREVLEVKQQKEREFVPAVEVVQILAEPLGIRETAVEDLYALNAEEAAALDMVIDDQWRRADLEVACDFLDQLGVLAPNLTPSFRAAVLTGFRFEAETLGCVADGMVSGELKAQGVEFNQGAPIETTLGVLFMHVAGSSRMAVVMAQNARSGLPKDDKGKYGGEPLYAWFEPIEDPRGDLKQRLIVKG